MIYPIDFINYVKPLFFNFKTHKESTQVIKTNKTLHELFDNTQHRLDDELIQACLKLRKENTIQTSELLHNYVNFRNKHNLSLGRITTPQIKSDMHEILTVKTSNGLTILTMNCSKLNGIPKNHQIYLMYLLEVVIFDEFDSPLNQESGIAICIDFSNTSFKLLNLCNKDDLKRGVDLWRCFPIKVKKVYVVNYTTSIYYIIKSVLKFTSLHIKNKVIFLKSINEL
jgi:hypothetical protein